jgi:hypothetical protein
MVVAVHLLQVVLVVEPVGVDNINGVQSHQEFLVKVTQAVQVTITPIGVIHMVVAVALVVQAVGEHQVQEEILEVAVPDYNIQSQVHPHIMPVVVAVAKVVVLGTAVVAKAAVDPVVPEVPTLVEEEVTVVVVQVL